MCSDRHLTALAAYAVKHNLSGSVTDRASYAALVREVFGVLARENLASLDARYPGDPGDAIGEPLGSAAAEHFSPIAIVKLCHSYSYQASEHTGWEGSRARRIVLAIEADAVRQVPGYADAPWAI